MPDTAPVNVPVVPDTAPVNVPVVPDTPALNVPVVPDTAPLNTPVVPETPPELVKDVQVIAPVEILRVPLALLRVTTISCLHKVNGYQTQAKPVEKS